MNLLMVGIGGFLGSCSRYLITKWSGSFTASFPLGTLLSNVLAGLLIGFIIGLKQNSVRMSDNTKLFLTTGLLGGLSTFSAFSLETIELFKAGKYFMSIGNIALNVGLSFLGVVIGFIAAKMFVNQP